MIRVEKTLFSLILILLFTQLAQGQVTVRPRLVWEVNKVNLGTIFEEQGPQMAQFNFTHTQDSLFHIEKIWTDCGCTTAEYTKDTLSVGDQGIVKVIYDPTTSAGYFSRMIIVQGNLMGSLDTLYIEGTAIPKSSNPQLIYPEQRANLGFRLSKINMGEVFTNEPKIKEVEVYNFGDKSFYKDSLSYAGPDYIRVIQLTDSIQPNDRGLLQFEYSGEKKNDLGFFEDQVQLFWKDSTLIRIPVMANVFEYYAPFSKENLNLVPQLYIASKEINLKTISSDSPQIEMVSLNNRGREVLEIHKVQGNCECLTLEIPQTSINPGETLQLKIIFDPKGRKGIDQRNIYVFSNDPVNPVQQIILKSRVE
jgi:hypothetical protein